MECSALNHRISLCGFRTGGLKSITLGQITENEPVIVWGTLQKFLIKDVGFRISDHNLTSQQLLQAQVQDH